MFLQTVKAPPGVRLRTRFRLPIAGPASGSRSTDGPLIGIASIIRGYKIAEQFDSMWTAMTLKQAEEFVVSDPRIMGGHPVFRGTRIPVCSIAEMLDRGATKAEILGGYPSLKPEHLEAASVWTKARPFTTIR